MVKRSNPDVSLHLNTRILAFLTFDDCRHPPKTKNKVDFRGSNVVIFVFLELRHRDFFRDHFQPECLKARINKYNYKHERYPSKTQVLLEFFVLFKKRRYLLIKHERYPYKTPSALGVFCPFQKATEFVDKT